MPIKTCTSSNKPGYQFGDSGRCYTYTPGNEESKNAAKAKALKQEQAARASGWTEKAEHTGSKEKEMIIRLPYENVEVMKKQHEEMIQWHETMRKEHEDAISWHKIQVQDLEKAIVKVPLNPEEVPAPSAGSPRGESTNKDENTATSHTEIPLDPTEKSVLIEMMKEVAETLNIKKSPEELVNQILKG